MEFGKHLSKGLWGIASKALPVVYGIGYVVLVIRVLPEEEFGNFVLIQEIFLITANLGVALALQPLLKYGAETDADLKQITGAALWLNFGFVALSSLLLVALRVPLASMLNAKSLEILLTFIPAMLAATFLRNLCLVLLQTRLRIKEIFWVDAAHFIGAPVLILVYSRMGIFDSALDLIIINIITLSLSSLVGIALSGNLLRFALFPRRSDVARMWDYGKYSLSSVVSLMFYSKADSFFLAAFSGPVAVAVYNSVKVFARVYEMVTQVVQMFVFPVSSKLAAEGNIDGLKKVLEKAITFSTVAMLPVLVAFLFFAPLIVGTIYGEKYAEAIPLLRILSVLCLVVPLTSVASSALLGLGHARRSFILGTMTLVASAVFYLALIPWLGPLGATLAFVLSSCVQAWLFAKSMADITPVTVAGTVSRLGDIAMFVRTKSGFLRN